MKKNNAVYNVVNLTVILMTAALFIYEYYDVRTIFAGRDIRHIIIIVITVFIVHFIKASRLYLALYGSDIDVRTYTKIYCKVTPVSVVFPFKIGEFFRMYCYGSEIRNLLKGIVTVILDRFMDTMALITIIILVWMFGGGRITVLAYILLLFLLFVLLIYFVFPGVYKSWKKYLLKAAATEQKLKILKMMDLFNNVYQEITSVSKGRGIILYFMSLAAWAVEIGSIALLNGITDNEQLNDGIAAYLSSAMGSGTSVGLKQFIFVSVIMMIAVYAVLKFCGSIFRKKEMQ